MCTPIRMAGRALFYAALVALARPATAQVAGPSSRDDSAHAAAVLEMLHQMHYVDRIMAYTDSMLADPSTPPQVREKRAVLIAKFREHAPELEARMVPVFSARLSTEDALAAAAFFGSPAGSHYLDIQAATQDELMAMYMEWAGTLMPELLMDLSGTPTPPK